VKKISLSQLKPYGAAKHFNMTAMRLQGKEESGLQKFWMGLSYFLPGGGAEWAYEDTRSISRLTKAGRSSIRPINRSRW
jgi:hypothetical protein